MNANVSPLLLVLAAGLGGTAAALRRRTGERRSFRTGKHLLRPHG